MRIPINVYNPNNSDVYVEKYEAFISRNGCVIAISESDEVINFKKKQKI
jgi:hypothetical protein